MEGSTCVQPHSGISWLMQGPAWAPYALLEPMQPCMAHSVGGGNEYTLPVGIGAEQAVYLGGW